MFDYFVPLQTYWQAPNGPHYVFFIQLYDNRTIQNVYNDIAFQSVRYEIQLLVKSIFLKNCHNILVALTRPTRDRHDTD